MQSEVRLLTREIQEVYNIESMRFHRSNMVSSEIVTRIQQTNLIRAYLPPANVDRIQDFEEALNKFLRKDTIVMGN